jgi:hypothetical protein
MIDDSNFIGPQGIPGPEGPAGPAGPSATTNKIYSYDTRSVDYKPSDRDSGLYADFKNNGTANIPNTSGYIGQLTFRSYGGSTDLTGGQPSQLAYDQTGAWHTRMGTGAQSWGKWTKFKMDTAVGTKENPAKASKDILDSDPTATTGWYWLMINGISREVWVDMDYNGGGWVLVATHIRDKSIPALTDVDSQSNLNTVYQSHTAITSSLDPRTETTLMALDGWSYITAANSLGGNVVLQANTVPIGLGDAPQRRSRWTFTGWDNNYSAIGVGNLNNEIGGTTPGFYSYHWNGGGTGRPWTTNNNDRDAWNGTATCSSNYNGAPFWYGSCWDGSFWGGNGGGGHANALHWTSSGGDNYNYGATYVK